MISHPTSAELLDAVTRILEEQIAPQVKDRESHLSRLRGKLREGAGGDAMETAAQARLVALLRHDGDVEMLTAELCAAIRSGAIVDDDPALLAHLTATTIDQVRIDQPNYSGLAQAIRS